jgi:hypothetical protein
MHPKNALRYSNDGFCSNCRAGGVHCADCLLAFEFDGHIQKLFTSYAPGCILMRSDSLRQLQLNAFLSLPGRYSTCISCRATLKSLAGCLWFSEAPAGLAEGVYGSDFPLDLAKLIASYVTDNVTLTPVLRLSGPYETLSPRPWDAFFNALAIDSKACTALADSKQIDPNSLSWKQFAAVGAHIPTSNSSIEALQRTRTLWELAGTVHAQAAKLNAIFGSSEQAVNELSLLRACVRLFFHRNPRLQQETECAVSFVPLLVQEATSRWSVVRALSNMGFAVTPSTYSANSVLYTLASILATTPVEVKADNKGDATGLAAMVAQVRVQEGLESNAARRVALTVWKLYMRNRGEGTYLKWCCPFCATRNDHNNSHHRNARADEGGESAGMETVICIGCSALQPSAHGWSCRNDTCDVRNYDVPAKQGGVVPKLCCQACGTERGLALGAWACAVCTFHNKIHVLRCEMCENPKP